MSWITITEEKVQARLAKPELDALLTAATQVAQTASGLLEEAISSVTSEVRGYVAACEKNILGPDGTIPNELEIAALALVRRHLFTRLPGMKRLYDELRQEETKDAIKKLENTAVCKFAILPPETPNEDQAAGPAVQLVSSRTRIAQPSQTAGL